MRLPTMKQLERAGADAGKLLDAYERYITAWVNTKGEYRRAMERIEARRDEFFGRSSQNPANHLRD